MAIIQISHESPTIGECIYCGRRDAPLSTEHAVPYGLNGEWTLLQASCQACAGATSKCERDALRGLLPTVRAVLNIRTRRRSERTLMLPVVLEANGVQQTVLVPLSEFPTYLPSPVFPPLGVEPSIDVSGAEPRLAFRHIAGPTFEEVGRKYPGTEFVGVRATYSPELFARMVAKIAYCAAVRVVGVAPIRHSGIRDVILGTDRQYGNWVESWNGDPPEDMSGLHAIQVHADTSGAELHVLVSLFAQFHSPVYHVLIGPVPDEFTKSANWQWR